MKLIELDDYHRSLLDDVCRGQQCTECFVHENCLQNDYNPSMIEKAYELKFNVKFKEIKITESEILECLE
jgi:hypothetical protein